MEASPTQAPVEATVEEYLDAQDKAHAEGRHFRARMVLRYDNVAHSGVIFTGDDGRLRIVRDVSKIGEHRRRRMEAAA